jgi:hypothetical protein
MQARELPVTRLHWCGSSDPAYPFDLLAGILAEELRHKDKEDYLSILHRLFRHRWCHLAKGMRV